MTVSSSPVASWRALEANPEVISSYANVLGGPGNLHYCDVLSTEDWALEMIPKPVHALLLVYPIKEDSEKRSKELQVANNLECEQNAVKKNILEQLWFTKQTVGNACGTVALLHTFANLKDRCPVQRGGYLETFYEKSRQLNPQERATALESDGSIMSAHAAAETEGQSDHREKVDEHFVAFVDCHGHVVELDGRKAHPIVHDAVDPSSGFLSSAVAVIKRDYIDADPGECRFSIIAVTTGLLDEVV